MYKCENCGFEFEEPITVIESHGLDSPPFERLSVCPRCKSTDFEEKMETEEYKPDLSEISKAIIKGIFHLNNFRGDLLDIFGTAAENSQFKKGYDCLLEALDIITAEEGMDEGVSDLIIDAKTLDSQLFKATDNFLKEAGLK